MQLTECTSLICFFMHRHPGYTFRPKPKKNKKPVTTKAKEADKSANQEDVKDSDHMPSPRFSCRVERERYYQQEQQYQLQQVPLAYANPVLSEGASSLYFQPTIDYVPAPLEDGLSLDTNNDAMYVDPALLHNGYMDINAAEPISFGLETDSAMFALMTNSTPSSQMLETPSLDYFQSPISLSHPVLGHQPSGYQQIMEQAMQQQLDTPHMLDQTVIPADYSNEYGKLFDSLDSSSSASSSDLSHMPVSNTQANNDFVSYMYGTVNPNITFPEQQEQWLDYQIN
ncbi:unnamed protein product [Mucor fragilis]